MNPELLAGSALTALALRSKVAATFVEKVADAIGTLIVEPVAVVIGSRAEVIAERHKAFAAFDLADELQQRGLIRLLKSEGRKQKNIESITKKALEDLASDATPEMMDTDWIANLYSKCESVSDPDMQSLWAKILAGEANRKKSFSKKTVELVSILDKEDAALFTVLCGFSWQINSSTPLSPLIFNLTDPIYLSVGMNYAALTHLDNLGLIKFNSISGLQVTYQAQHVIVGYRGKPYIIRQDNAAPLVLHTGKVDFTQAGAQLARISGAQEAPNFETYTLDKWAKKGWTISPIEGAILNDDNTLTSINKEQGTS